MGVTSGGTKIECAAIATGNDSDATISRRNPTEESDIEFAQQFKHSPTTLTVALMAPFSR